MSISYNALPSEIRQELVLHDQVSVDFTTKDQLWTAVLRVDHAFDSLKAISAYKGETTPIRSSTNHKGTNFNKRSSSATLGKGANAQNNARTLFNQKLNSTSTKMYNNFPSNNYSNNRYTNPGSTQKSNSYYNYNKDEKGKDNRQSSSLSKLPSNQARPLNDKARNPICYKCGKIGFARDCLRHPYKPRVFTLGINGELVEAKPEPQEQLAEEANTGSHDEDPVHKDADGGEEDQYIKDPYDPSQFEILEEDKEAQETLDKSPSFNILSFIEATEEDFVMKLASTKRLEFEEEEPTDNTSKSQVTGSKVPNKVVK